MTKSLTTWYCDVCGELINDARNGYVIWKTTKDHKSHSFKIVHQRECDLDSHCASAALIDFLAIGGLLICCLI